MIFKADVVFGPDQTFAGMVVQGAPIGLYRDSFILDQLLAFCHQSTAFFHIGHRQCFGDKRVKLGVGPAEFIPRFA